VQKSAKYAFIAVVVIIVFGGLGFYWFFLRDDAPKRASLRAATATTVTTGAGSTEKATADGTWVVAPGEGVFVGYRVEEQFAGDSLKKAAVGRTAAVEGSLTVAGAQVTKATITADVTQLKSDRTQRDGQIVDRGLQTRTFPQATFELTTPIQLPGAAEKGRQVDVTATGQLTLHGQTRTVEIPLQAVWDGATITVAGGTKVQFGDYGIEAPTNGIVTVADTGEFELQLTFVPS
jgi:polyisoprenoid-binding protein YceI